MLRANKHPGGSSDGQRRAGKRRTLPVREKDSVVPQSAERARLSHHTSNLDASDWSSGEATRHTLGRSATTRKDPAKHQTARCAYTSWNRGTATACADVHDSRGGLGYRYGSDRRGGGLHALAAATIDGQERLTCSNRRACASCGRDLLISAQQENARRQKRSIRSKPWVRVQNRYTAFADFSVPGASRSRRVRRLDDAKASRQNGRARQGVPACQSGYPY